MCDHSGCVITISKCNEYVVATAVKLSKSTFADCSARGFGGQLKK